MKKFLVFLICALCTLCTFAQTTTNADGSIKYRGNVAIMVTSHFFTFKNGTFEQQVNNEVASNMKSALNALAIQKFGNSGFAVVNRDGEAYANLQKILEEQKLEDYIDGFTTKAKGQGADCLFLCDYTTYEENDFCQNIISCRIIDIATNIGHHYTLKSKPYKMENSEKMVLTIRQNVSDFEKFLYKIIREVYPQQYGVVKADGKRVHLVANYPNARTLLTDKFYIFKLSQNDVHIGNYTNKTRELDPIAVATYEGSENGYVVAKSNKSITASNDLIVFKEEPMPLLPVVAVPWTFFALNYDTNTYEGFIKKRVNDAVYDAITRHPAICLIEQEHLPELKKERELQKTEDFLDGHTVQQMKASGAEYMIHLQNFKMDGTQVAFQMNLISISENRILRSVEVTTSIDNIENEMYKQISERWALLCSISFKDNKTLDVKCSNAFAEGDKLTFQVNKQIKNPLTGEVTYSKIDVCKATVSEYHNTRFLAKVDKILSDEDYKDLEKTSVGGSVSFIIDGSEIETDQSTTSDLQDAVKKEEKKEKGSPANVCGLGIDSRQSEQEELSVYNTSELCSKLFDFRIERFCRSIG